LLGLDSVIVTGTGAGKTMPFMMPLLLNDKKMVIIISLLKILQADQVQYHYQFSQINTDGFKRQNDSKNCVFK
jgi:superfamily II DNA helicase RecQ